MNILVTLFLVPNFSLKIGIMIMSAMFLGAALSFNWKDIRKVMFIILIFVVYQMWIHDTILDVVALPTTFNHIEESLANIVVSCFLAVLYCAGLVGGMYIVHVAKRPEENKRAELESRLQEIQEGAKNKEEKDKLDGQ